MMEGWNKYSFEKCIVKNRIGRNNQINASEIQDEGEFPVIDQGQSFIAGYTNETEKVVSVGLPYIIFGDHTRCIKYIDFPFVIGADGTKVISPNIELFDPKFFFFQLLNLDVQNRGYNRHFILLKEKVLIRPPLPEQRQIAHVLSSVQKAIEHQNKLISTTTELKKVLMQKLFIEGTRGEHQKQTEIGLVPESWEVVKMGDCLLQTQYGLSVKGNDAGEVPILRMTNQKDGNISGDNLQYVNISEKELNKFKVNIGDVIFNRTNSFELVGRTAIFNLEGDYVFASYLIRLITNSEKLYPEFLNLYLNADETQYRLKSIATRGVSQSNISATRLSGFVIPLPSLAEQREIISTIKAFNVKINCNEKKKQTLTDLFKTLLHELMSGQRRVHELDFENENVLETA